MDFRPNIFFVNFVFFKVSFCKCGNCMSNVHILILYSFYFPNPERHFAKYSSLRKVAVSPLNASRIINSV